LEQELQLVDDLSPAIILAEGSADTAENELHVVHRYFPKGFAIDLGCK